MCVINCVILQRFLISLPGGVFSEEGEEILLKVLTIGHKMEQYDAIHEYVKLTGCFSCISLSNIYKCIE